MFAVQERTHWWNPDLKPQVEPPQSSVVEGVGGAISEWVADERKRVPGQEPSPMEEKMPADLVQDGKLRELAAWKSLMLTRNEIRVMFRRKSRKRDGFFLGRSVRTRSVLGRLALGR